MKNSELYDAIELLQDLLIHLVGTNTLDAVAYKRVRRELLEHPATGKRVPEFIKQNRDGNQIRHFFDKEFVSDSDRKEFIWASFSPLLDSIEFIGTPVEHSTSDLLARLGMPAVHEAWTRALLRYVEDPAGAITSARTFLEEVCKHILTDLGIHYEAAADLPKLYRATAEALNIAPSQHTEPVFKQILGGCTAVVEGLGALRNRVGDAHGGGPRPVRPAPRHAQLAIDLAGSVATYLFATWELRKREAAG